MQRSLALDGVEWAAADMTFDQTGRINAVENRTLLWAGTSGVFTGGVVTTVSGLTLAVSGPLQFHANGHLGIINAPANVAAVNGTNYVIAVYQETQDTPATFYGGGAPPNIHANETPTVICRTTTAVLANNEVLLATVTAAGGAITLITDSRVILPTVSGGNIALGAGATIDGMDPSAHQVLQATSSVLGHVKMGPGGAAPYGTSAGSWVKDEFLDVGSTFAATKLLDDADFGAPPASSQPFAGSGSLLFIETNVPTRYGDLCISGSGQRVCQRYTLTFTSTAVFSVNLYLQYWDDTIRVKANGASLYTNSAPNTGTYVALNFNTVIGTNTIQVYLYNNTGQFNASMACSILSDARVTFTG